jgi:hypothetical protein
VAIGGLRGALAVNALATSPWPSLGADETGSPADAARCEALLSAGSSVAEIELSERLSCVTTTLAQLQAGEVSATESSIAAFDDVISRLQALKVSALAGLASSVSEKRSLLHAEGEGLAVARDSFSRISAAVRAALSHLNAIQFAAVYPTLSTQLTSVMALARSQPQVRKC